MSQPLGKAREDCCISKVRSFTSYPTSKPDGEQNDNGGEAESMLPTVFSINKIVFISSNNTLLGVVT